ncbi:right-handed parallel beta-helix repeat-containing protein [Bacillus rubiinfantis]|uniref:right-handed parallel beta-helix repeat-containing protein n=1 Tax=Bacillus rubiinfantis TaxID=1499680 RepID=UPI0005A9A3DD|nr:right-handed parallel beta-helix repeat-containing protein [Bacillus rubiinfantis]
MKGRKLKLLAILVIAIGMMVPISVQAAAKTYTVASTSKPYKGQMTNFSTYNKYTRQYYLLRSYLERLEKIGGGMLVLKKGTYTIPKTLYVPSNVTVRLKNGVKIVKGTKTGTKKIGPSKTLFQLVKPSISLKKGVRGKYDGEKNITFIGEGKAIVDLNYEIDTIAIVAGHNRNIKIQNIQFQNLKQGHFIEIDATDKALIANNKFTYSKPSANRNKEAINLDTPDKLTNGWNHPWSKYDKTPNRNITIENNKFYNLDRAIGTHKYSQGKYHDKIIVRGNYIEKMRQDAIRVMNWSNAVIERNTIKNVSNRAGTYRGIFASGVINPAIRNNFIEDVARPIGIMPWKNIGPGSDYAVTSNSISQSNIEELKTNRIKNTTENFIRINLKYNVFDQDTLKIPL